MFQRNYGCRINDAVVLDGNHAIVMENKSLRLTYLVDRGMDCIEMLYKPQDVDLMWHSPVPLHKRSDYMSHTGDSFCNYLDHNSGGWQEILPNGGGECHYKGACLGMHGEISNVPWQCHILRDTAEEVALRAEITTLRSPFKLVKEISLKGEDSAVEIREWLYNLADEPMQLMWGNHPTIGEPFLEKGCRIETNAKTAFTIDTQDFDTQRLRPGTRFVWPTAGDTDFSIVPGADNHTADMLYLTDFPEKAAYRVRNDRLHLSYGMEWDANLFPYLWMWQVCRGSYGYPWYGRTYNMALEPWTSWPSGGLEEAIRNGSALTLEAGGCRETAMRFFIAPTE